jgi:hypothetical protein
MRELETLLIHIAKPKGNKQIGKFRTSENLKPKLKREMHRYQNREFESFFGNEIPFLSTKPAAHGEPSLKGYFKKRTRIRLTYKEKEHTAKVLNSGKIKYQNQIFNSPSVASSFILGRHSNGWYWWKYKTKKGEWVRLDSLRK